MKDLTTQDKEEGMDRQDLISRIGLASCLIWGSEGHFLDLRHRPDERPNHGDEDHMSTL